MPRRGRDRGRERLPRLLEGRADAREWLREGKSSRRRRLGAGARSRTRATRRRTSSPTATCGAPGPARRGGGGELPFTPRLAGFAVARGDDAAAARAGPGGPRLARLGATAADGAVPSGPRGRIPRADAKLAASSAAASSSDRVAARRVWIKREVRARMARRSVVAKLRSVVARRDHRAAVRGRRDGDPSARPRERTVRAGARRRARRVHSAAAPAANLRWQVLEPEGLVTAASKQDVLEFTAPFGLRQRRIRVRALADRTPPAPLEGTLEITAGEPAHAALPADDAVALAGLGSDWYAGGDDPAARQSFGERRASPPVARRRQHALHARAVSIAKMTVARARASSSAAQRPAAPRRRPRRARRRAAPRAPRDARAPRPTPRGRGAAARLLEIELPIRAAALGARCPPAAALRPAARRVGPGGRRLRGRARARARPLGFGRAPLDDERRPRRAPARRLARGDRAAPLAARARRVVPPGRRRPVRPRGPESRLRRSRPYSADRSAARLRTDFSGAKTRPAEHPRRRRPWTARTRPAGR